MKNPRKALPWLDPKNYAACAHWGCAMWFAALRPRLQFKEELKELPKLTLSDWLFYFLEPKRFEEGFNNVETLRDGKRYRFSAVEPMTLFEALMIHRELGEWCEGHDKASAILESSRKPDSESRNLKARLAEELYDGEFLARWAEYFDDPTPILGRAHFTVDLNASDALLMAQFAACIANLRKTLRWETSQRKFTGKDFAEWHKLRLLPYIDLAFYSQVHECKFTDEEMGTLLFPEDYDRDLGRYISETIRPTALNLLTRGTLNALHGQLLKQHQKPVNSGGRPTKKRKAAPRSKI